MENEFPLLTMIYNIAFRDYDPKLILEACRMHSSHPPSTFSYMVEPDN